MGHEKTTNTRQDQSAHRKNCVLIRQAAFASLGQQTVHPRKSETTATTGIRKVLTRFGRCADTLSKRVRHGPLKKFCEAVFCPSRKDWKRRSLAKENVHTDSISIVCINSIRNWCLVYLFDFQNFHARNSIFKWRLNTLFCVQSTCGTNVLMVWRTAAALSAPFSQI